LHISDAGGRLVGMRPLDGPYRPERTKGHAVSTSKPAPRQVCTPPVAGPASAGAIGRFPATHYLDDLIFVQMPSAESGLFTPGTPVLVTVRTVPVLAVAGRGLRGGASAPEAEAEPPVAPLESTAASEVLRR
jgi:hypothetical protein